MPSGSNWVSEVDERQCHERPARAGTRRRRPALPEAEHRSHAERAVQQLDHRVTCGNRRPARRATSAEEQEAHHGNVLERGNRVAAGGALRARRDEVVVGQVGRGFSRQLGALGTPAALEHLGQTMDDYVDEAPDAKAYYPGDSRRRQRVV